jgi:hypothetical protein
MNVVLTVKDDSTIPDAAVACSPSVSVGALCVVIPITKHLLEGDRLLRACAFNSINRDGMRGSTNHKFLQQFLALYDERADTVLLIGVLPNGEDNIALGNNASDGLHGAVHYRFITISEIDQAAHKGGVFGHSAHLLTGH